MTKTINGIRIASVTETQAAIINQARQHSSNDERKQIKREVFSVLKAKFGIPENFKLKANTTGEGQRQHLVLHVGGKGPDAGKAFRLGDDGKFDGTLLSTADLFPPPPPVAVQSDGEGNSNDGTYSHADVQQGGSVFGDQGKWYRLDPNLVARLLTDPTAADDYDANELVVDHGAGDTLPTPHLMLHGRTDLAIVQDGSIYRRA